MEDKDVQETASDAAPAHTVQHAETLALPAKAPAQHEQLKGPAHTVQQQEAGMQDTTGDTIVQHAEASAQPAQPAQVNDPAPAAPQQEAAQGTTDGTVLQHAEASAWPAQLHRLAHALLKQGAGMQDMQQDTSGSSAHMLQHAEVSRQPAEASAEPALVNSPAHAVHLQARCVQDSSAQCAAAPAHMQGPAAGGQRAQQHADAEAGAARSQRLQAAAASARSVQDSHLALQPVAPSPSADDTVLQHKWASMRPSAHAAPAAPGSGSCAGAFEVCPMQLAKPSTNTQAPVAQVNRGKVCPSGLAASAIPGNNPPMPAAMPSTNHKDPMPQVSSTNSHAEPAHLGAPSASLLQLQALPATSCAAPNTELCAPGCGFDGSWAPSTAAALTGAAQEPLQYQQPPLLQVATNKLGHLQRASLRTAQQREEHTCQIPEPAADEPAVLHQTTTSDLSHGHALTERGNSSSRSSSMVSSEVADDDLLDAYYDAQTEHNAWRYMRLVTAGRAGLFVAQNCRDSSAPSCDQGPNFVNPISSIHTDQQHTQAAGIHAQAGQQQRQPQLDAHQHSQQQRQQLLALRHTPYPDPVPTARSAFYAELDVEMHPDADAVTVKGTPYQRAWVAVKAAVRDKNAADAAAAGVGGSGDGAIGTGLPGTLGWQQQQLEYSVVAAPAASEGGAGRNSGPSSECSSCQSAVISSSDRHRLSLQEQQALQWQALQEQHDQYTSQQQQGQQNDEGKDDMPQQWRSEPLTPEQLLVGAVVALQRQQRLLLDQLEKAESMNSNRDSWAGWGELVGHCWQWLLSLFGSSAEADGST